MADALGVAASIVAVATAGFQVAQALYQIAEGIGGAGREVRVYAKEVAVFSKVLNNIRNAILRPDVKSAELSLVKDITDICEDVLEPLNRIRKTLESLLERYRDSKRKLEQLKQRIHWYFSKRNKLLFYREALRGHQQNLDTVLAAMNFNATRDIMNKVALQNTLLEGKMLTNAFSGGPVQRPPEFDSQSPQALIASAPSDSMSADENSSTSIQEEVSHATVEIADVTASLTAVAIAGAAPEEHSEPLTEYELQKLDGQIDRDLDPDQGNFAHVLAEDIRSLSRRTKRFAEGVVREAETVAENLSAAPKASTQATPDPASVRRSSDETTLQGSEGESSQAGIMFKDTWGETWELPFKEIRTWEAMFSTIRKIYSLTMNSPHEELYIAIDRLWTRETLIKGVAAALKTQSFVVRGPSGQNILPELWHFLIRPGWQVTLSFQDMSLNIAKSAEKRRREADNFRKQQRSLGSSQGKPTNKKA